MVLILLGIDSKYVVAMVCTDIWLIGLEVGFRYTSFVQVEKVRQWVMTEEQGIKPVEGIPVHTNEELIGQGIPQAI